MLRRFTLLKNNICSFSTMKKAPQDPTIFDKIISKQIQSSYVYEDDKVFFLLKKIYAFNDIHPQAPVHVLIIPKLKDGLTGLSNATEKNQQMLGYMMLKVNEIAKIKGIDKTGYRIVINDGPHGQQSVNHLHIHLLGGRQMTWPPG